MRTFVKFFFFIAFAGQCGAAAAAGKFFCCNDAAGKQTCGDILPQACYGRAYREVGENGMIIRHVEAPLTPEQRAQIAAEEAQRRALEEQRREQQRKDDALLATYSAENDIELMRETSLADIKKAISNAEGRISEFRTRREKLEAEAASYRVKGSKKNPPPEIQKGIDDADREIQLQEEFIATRKNEAATIQAKYDQDLQRYRKIKRQRMENAAKPPAAPSAAPLAPTPSAAPVPPAPASSAAPVPPAPAAR